MIIVIMKTKFWIILFCGLIIASLGAYFVLQSISVPSVAYVFRDGECVEEIDLSSVSEPYEITVTTDDGGVNVIYVENGHISISSANCPDQICVRHSPISDGVEPIVCLPNRIVVQIGKSESDVADSYSH